MRTFEDKAATRGKVPLMVGLMGPSGGGKTFSALRLATGIKRVTGGDVFLIDTEARRSLHYADQFDFRHVQFDAPFGSLDYLEAIKHCVSRGAGVVIVDSLSHEHEGPGGVLEMHDQECDRLMKLWGSKRRDAVQMSAWAKPKADRRRFINSLLQLQVSLIACFRSKEKIRPVKGGKPEDLGWMPIAGEEFLYEMTAATLLLPGSNGTPTWHADRPGEQQMIKLPRQFQEMFAKRQQLSEDIGEQMARWADGGSAGASSNQVATQAGVLTADIARAQTPDELASLKPLLTAAKKTLKPDELKQLADHFKQRTAELSAPVDEERDAIKSEGAQ